MKKIDASYSMCGMWSACSLHHFNLIYVGRRVGQIGPNHTVSRIHTNGLNLFVEGLTVSPKYTEKNP